ncbi:MAG TPA: TetR/AcrR family transcriptional regulator [Candidatus Limnocylindria bacterium]|nr:TetR/AcrR family transcriptional regulator [Candidatus Limnocylindria bacterium]
MPAPARTSLDDIVAAGLRIAEQEGLAGLRMQRVAQAVGVRPPSLYKHVAGRDELVRRVIGRLATELAETLEQAATIGEPATDLRAMADVVRAFAHARPGAYGLLFGHLPDEWRPESDLLARASAPILRVTGHLSSEEHALDAARTFVAWLHGFIDMELAGAFRLGGDVDSAFTFGVERLAHGVTAAG